MQNQYIFTVKLIVDALKISLFYARCLVLNFPQRHKDRKASIGGSFLHFVPLSGFVGTVTPSQHKKTI
jgi:hypothetical protein